MSAALLTLAGVGVTALGTVISAIFGYKNHALGLQIHINTNSRYDELKIELTKVREEAKIAANAAIAAAAAVAAKQTNTTTST